jgi:arabinogalactan endo-1,4-beta-galactosidase
MQSDQYHPKKNKSKIKIMINRLLFLKIIMSSVFVLCFSFFGCTDDPKIMTPVVPDEPKDTTFVKGADISWITEMEASGRKFYDRNGKEMDCFDLMKSLGMNAIRLRVWVDPQGGWNGVKDVLAKAKRAKALNMQLLIDFHYSDSWADPGKQTKPKAWENKNFEELKAAVTAHTTEVLQELKNNNITPEWVQVGNETNDGMLWPDGKASLNNNANIANFAQLFSVGYNASKAVFPDTKVMLHLSNGWDNGLYRWMLDGLKSRGVTFDIIGMSLYPLAASWRNTNTQCLKNAKDMIARYKVPVMIVEVGMPWDQADACYQFIKDLMDKMKSIPDGNGLGVMYWEPQCYKNWNGYSLGAFDNSGKPTIALDAFKD